MLEQRALELVRFAGRKLGRPHLRRGPLADRRQAVVERGRDPPTAGEVERTVRLDRSRHREVRRRVARALPAVTLGEERLAP